jgi:hypothetical protein
MSADWGWGIWLIALVLAFNLTCIPAWFLVGHLRRGSDFEKKRLETFLYLLRERSIWEDAAGTPLEEAVTQLEEHLTRAEHMGPLWGRKHTTMAQFELARICDLHPQDGAEILEQMER